jgi:hypothetical protein
MTLTHGIDKRRQLFYFDLTMRWPDPILKPLESDTISKNIRSLEQNIEITTLTLSLPLVHYYGQVKANHRTTIRFTPDASLPS